MQEIVDAKSWHLPPGEALDVACGKGRNAIFLAARGFHVTAIDISPVGLAEGRRQAENDGLLIDWQQADLQTAELSPARYDLIVNINYLQRSLFGPVRSAVKIGGHVICETYLIDQQTIGHPKNPEYLLAPNELLTQFRKFRVLFYREGIFIEGDEPSVRAGIFAQRVG